MSALKTDSIIMKSKSGEQRVERAKPENVEEALRLIEDLKFFLATAPANWQENQVIRRYYLNNDEGFVSCVFWNNLYYITGTDIVRCCVYRMQKFGREVVERKKFEEGIFSDLRNLKCGVDATLEMPKSEFLSFLYKNLCLKTQKKQKVFFWFSVPHDKLFADALERDLRREVAGQPSTTRAIAEPALTFRYDDQSGTSLYDQVVQHVDTKRIDIYSGPSSVSHVGPDMIEDDDDDEADDYDDKNDMPIDIPQKARPKLSHSPDLTGDLTTAEVDLSSGIGVEGEASTAATNYSPQELVIEAVDVDDPEYAMGGNINPADLLTKEDDDFPLDYFPLEIEYPRQEQQQNRLATNQLLYDTELEAFPAMPHTAALYEPPFVHGDISAKVLYGAMPPTSTAAPTPIAPSLQATIPPPPLSVTRTHFMTNGEYYATAKPKDIKARDTDDDASNEDQESDNMNEPIEEHVPISNNPRNSSGTGAFPPQDAYLGYQGIPPAAMYPYVMPDFFYNNPYPGGDELYEQWMHMQFGQPQQNDLFMPPQAPFMGRSFTPIYRTTPTNPYMAISPYQSKPPTSSSAKNFPFYQGYYGRRGNMHSYLRGFPSIQATQPSSATRMHFVKHNRVGTQNPAASASGIASAGKPSHMSTKKKVVKPRTQHMKNTGKMKRTEQGTGSQLASNPNIISDAVRSSNQTEEQTIERGDTGSPVNFQSVMPGP
ncbi:AaceriADR304Wp [[Ashbya] aceris (nom. inval.)]|nr:AaceriADR304Wp [[Ashbya] aceris (nom. inval.)]